MTYFKVKTYLSNVIHKGPDSVNMIHKGHEALVQALPILTVIGLEVRRIILAGVLQGLVHRKTWRRSLRIFLATQRSFCRRLRKRRHPRNKMPWNHTKTASHKLKSHLERFQYKHNALICFRPVKNRQRES